MGGLIQGVSCNCTPRVKVHPIPEGEKRHIRLEVSGGYFT